MSEDKTRLSRRDLGLFAGISLAAGSGGVIRLLEDRKEKRSQEKINEFEDAVRSIDSDIIRSQGNSSVEFEYLPPEGYKTTGMLYLEVDLNNFDGPRHLSENRPEILEDGAELFGTLVNQVDAGEYDLMHKEADDYFKVSLKEEEIGSEPGEAYRQSMASGENVTWSVYE